MIAPLRTKTDERPSATQRRLRAARRMLASALLPPPEAPLPSIARWKAWLLVGWVVGTAVLYALFMSRFLTG